jgi:hypothetical protein
MRLLFFSLTLLGITSTLSVAQIKVESERDNDGNVLIFATNTELIPYSVILNFSTLQNLTTTGGGNVTAIALPGIRVNLSHIVLVIRHFVLIFSFSGMILF